MARSVRMARMKAVGGQGGIRTHEGLAPLPVFKTGAFNRSATCPLGHAASVPGGACHVRNAVFLNAIV